MEPVATKVLDGLLEGLVLHAIEREPSHGYGILKDLEAAMGEAPNKNRVYRLLRELEEEGLVVSEEITEEARSRTVYHLTEEGDQRLARYRELPGPFKAWLAGLFEVEGGPAAVPGPTPASAGVDQPDIEAADAWVHELLAHLPADVPVQAPHARFSMERTPGEARWRLTVERHRPGEYEDAEACPLTFVYLAIQRLLYEADR